VSVVRISTVEMESNVDVVVTVMVTVMGGATFVSLVLVKVRVWVTYENRSCVMVWITDAVTNETVSMVLVIVFEDV